MKHLLLTTIAAVVLVGCGESQPEPPTAKEPNISILEAVTAGNITVVKQYLADKTLHEGIEFWKILNVAVIEGHKEIAELVISEGANVEIGIPENPLNLAALEGHKEIAELLISKGADVNAMDINGRTPLIEAINGNQIELIKLLIAKGADMNPKYHTPLHHAAMCGHKEVVELLIAAGADVNRLFFEPFKLQGELNDGQTPLDWAIKGKHTKNTNLVHDETIALLRKHGGKTAEELKAQGK